MKKKYTKWEECVNLKEVKALIGLKHSNIVTLKELVLANEDLHLIFEFIGINLYEFMTQQSKEMPEIKIRNIIYQVLQGLAHMHKQNFFHRDLKPENILINEDNVKIADFGLAKEIRTRPPFTDYVATRWYRSPEVILKSKNYNSPIDIFAVGAIMAELYNSKPLFPGKSELEQMNKICEILGTPNQTDWAEGHLLAGRINYKFPSCKGQKLRNIIPRANDNAISLLESVLHFNPLKRPSAAQCLQHPYFQCYDILTLYGLKLINVNNQAQAQSVNNNNHSNHTHNKLSSTSLNSNSTSSAVSNTPIRVSSNVQIETTKKKMSMTNNIFNLLNTNKMSGTGSNSNTNYPALSGSSSNYNNSHNFHKTTHKLKFDDIYHNQFY